MAKNTGGRRLSAYALEETARRALPKPFPSVEDHPHAPFAHEGGAAKRRGLSPALVLEM